jgi:hypothetical protein
MTTTNPIANLPIPAGFSADDWADIESPHAFRTLWGLQRSIGDGAAVVRASLMQYPDGTVETDDDESPCIHIDICRDWGLTREEAREVATAILAVADELDRLTHGTDQP